MTEKLLDIPAACAVLGVSRSTLYKILAAPDAPPFIKIGRSTRLRESSLVAWMERQEKKSEVFGFQRV